MRTLVSLDPKPPRKCHLSCTGLVTGRVSVFGADREKLKEVSPDVDL